MVCVVSVVAISELSPDAETPTEIETVGDIKLLFTFSSTVQAVNVPAINIMLNIIAIFFFILSPSFQATSISKDFEMSRDFLFAVTYSAKNFPIHLPTYPRFLLHSAVPHVPDDTLP